MEVNKSRVTIVEYRRKKEKFEDIKWVIRSHNSRTGNTLAKRKNGHKNEQLSTRTKRKTKYQATPTLL